MKRFLVLAAVLTLNPMGMAQKTAVNGVVQLSAADNGKDVYVQAGDIIKVTLKSNPTTGYGWYALETDSTYLTLLKKDQQTVNNGMPGRSTQTTVYSFRVLKSLKKGTYTTFTPLAFLNYRPGNGQSSPGEMIEFSVISR